MASIQTERDTALSTYALRLKNHLKECDYSDSSLNVKIAYNQISDEIDTLISRLEDIPVIIIGRSSQIKIDGTLGMINRDTKDRFYAKPDNGGGAIELRGYYFTTINKIQIAVVARTQSENIKIAVEVLRFNNEYYRTYFDVLLKNGETRYRCSNASFIELMDVREKEFSTSTNKDIALEITAVEYDVKERNMRLGEEDNVNYQMITEVCDKYDYRN